MPRLPIPQNSCKTSPMKNLTILLALTFSVMFSSPSYAEWKRVSVNVKGNVTGSTFYVDFERIRKHGGYVYFWQLTDLLKRDKYGDLSELNYKQGDCNLFRYKILSGSFFKEPMGGGSPQTATLKNPKWKYPRPNSSGGEVTLKSVCSR